MWGGGKSFSSGLEGFGVSLLPEALLWGRSFPPSAPHALLPRLRGTGLTLQVSHAGEAMGSFGCSLGEGDGDGWVRGICSSPCCGPGQRCAWRGFVAALFRTSCSWVLVPCVCCAHPQHIAGTGSGSGSAQEAQPPPGSYFHPHSGPQFLCLPGSFAARGRVRAGWGSASGAGSCGRNEI